MWRRHANHDAFSRRTETNLFTPLCRGKGAGVLVEHTRTTLQEIWSEPVPLDSSVNFSNVENTTPLAPLTN